MTARWVVDEVQPHRDIKITWQPISLFFKNSPPEEQEEYHRRTFLTHRFLRVMESIRTDEGSDGVFRLYWELGARLHHDRNRDFEITSALEAAGLDTSHAVAFDDEKWDEEIRTRMELGLRLVGDDIGTPIIGFTNDDGEKVGLFGPVITRVPSTEQSLKLWDGFTMCATVPGFWELKRTRTERPDFGDRP
ncbi:MAG: disulfide bond formation protein DsbA [Acidimicrobiales bacterium]